MANTQGRTTGGVQGCGTPPELKIIELHAPMNLAHLHFIKFLILLWAKILFMMK